MTTTMTPDAIEATVLEAEHRRLRAGLAGIRETIADAHHLSRSSAGDRVARALAWLRNDVLPHAAWEETWLYPHLDTIAATTWTTRALRVEHDQIREAAADLERAFQAVDERWSNELAFRLVVALTRLETLLGAHLAQEERFVMPLLEGAATPPADVAVARH